MEVEDARFLALSNEDDVPLLLAPEKCTDQENDKETRAIFRIEKDINASNIAATTHSIKVTKHNRKKDVSSLKIKIKTRLRKRNPSSLGSTTLDQLSVKSQSEETKKQIIMELPVILSPVFELSRINGKADTNVVSIPRKRESEEGSSDSKKALE